MNDLPENAKAPVKPGAFTRVKTSQDFTNQSQPLPFLRQITIFELKHLVQAASQKNRHVILMARQGGICGRSRAEALRPLLTNPV